MNIAVSSGHHASHAVAIDGAQLIGLASGESLSRHCFSERTVLDRLKSLIESLRVQVVGPDSAAVPWKSGRFFLSLPGVATKDDERRVESLMKKSGWPVGDNANFSDDTWTGLVAGLRRLDGICAFAGTGASVLVSHGPDEFRGKPFKLDGWGPMIGDFGSGFRLVMRLLEEIGRHLDETGKAPPIFEDLLLQLEAPAYRDLRGLSINNVQGWFSVLQRKHRRSWPMRLASLASVITDAVTHGRDSGGLAGRLIDESAKQMAKTIRLAHDSATLEADGLPITCQGGMFRHSTRYLATVDETVRASIGKPVSPATYHPVVGAAILTSSPDWTLPREEIVSNILQSVAALPDPQRSLLYFPNQTI